MDGLLIALIILLAYVALVYLLKARGFLEKHNMSNWGPFIMWRTKRGRGFIERLSKPKRFWRGYAAVGKLIIIVVMFAMLALLVWEALLVSSIPADQAPGLDMLIGIPGINPIIPIWYGILGLVVAVIIHEFAHGILTRVGDMKLKALGIVWMVIPMGAFAEPEEEELLKTDKKRRTSVFAVGPATNIIFALICAFLFSTVMLSSAQVVREGPVVTDAIADSPATHIGMLAGDQIVSINGAAVPSTGFASIQMPDPGSTVPISYYRNGLLYNGNITVGLFIASVLSGEPAEKAGVKAGMLLTYLNGSAIRSTADFTSTIQNIAPGSTVSVSVLAYNTSSLSYEPVASVTSISTAIHTGTNGKPIAFLGVTSAYLGISLVNPHVILNTMAHPLTNSNGQLDIIRGTLVYIGLPFTGYQPMNSAFYHVFSVGGMSPELFWILANSLYWLFWINIMVGLTNALPAVPLDGGYLFKDWLDSIVARVKKDAGQEQRERYVNAITLSISFLILFLILWQIIGPRIL
jgi:membrane-associated protease RseP (regulator of RpoE activity)